MKHSRLVNTLPFFILLGGFALRLYRLGAESLWYDETVSLLLARSSLAELIRHTAGDIHPPFYYLLLHFWGQLAGWSEFSSAFFSLGFGVLLIALVYHVARTLLTREIGLVAAFLVAVSPYNIQYSQEVRMYTLGATLGLASVYFLWQILRAPKFFSRDFCVYVIVTALGIYTLYYLIFLLAFEYLFVGAWLIGKRIQKSHLFRVFITTQIALALLYLPWLPNAIRQATDPPVPPWRSFTPLPDVLLQSFSALVAGQSVEPREIVPLLVLAFALVAYLFTQHRPRLVSLFLLAYTFIPVLAIFLFSQWTPLYHVRYIYTYSPAFYILLALAISVITKQITRQKTRIQLVVTSGTLALIAGVSAYSLNNFWFDARYADEDLRGAVQHIAENWRPGDVILINAGYTYPALLYYYPAPIAQRERLVNYRPALDDAQNAPLVLVTGSINGSPRLGWNDPQSDFYPTTAEETRAALDRVFQAHPRAWMLRIYDTVTDPDGVIRTYFAAHARMIDDQAFTGESNARVQGFLTQIINTLPAQAAPLNAQLENRVILLGFESTTAPLRGNFYDAVLYWQPLQTLNYNYQLSLQILDANGNVVAQHDETPLGDTLPTSRWRVGEIYREPVRVQLPKTVASGEYTALVKLYNLNSGQVLGTPIRLATFVIER